MTSATPASVANDGAGAEESNDQLEMSTATTTLVGGGNRRVSNSVMTTSTSSTERRTSYQWRGSQQQQQQQSMDNETQLDAVAVAAPKSFLEDRTPVRGMQVNEWPYN